MIRHSHLCHLLSLPHVSLPDDPSLPQVALAEAVGGAQCPLILGGHDHEPYELSNAAGSCRVLKAGIDAEAAHLVDIVWADAAADTQPTITHTLVDVRTMDASREHAYLAALVAGYQSRRARLDRTVLKTLERRSPTTNERPFNMQRRASHC